MCFVPFAVKNHDLKEMVVHLDVSFSLERATDNDLDEIVALENRAYPFPWKRNILFAEIHGQSFSYTYVARLHANNRTPGSLIGYIFFWLVADEIHILNVAVDPDYQRKGLGTALMEFATGFGLEHGATKLLLEVRASNTPAQHLYARLGFTQIGLRKRYYADNKENAYVMQKFLLPRE